VAEQSSVIGKDITRIDGVLKVTGAAPYSVEYPLQNMAWGVGIGSTVGAGKITSIDSTEAEKMPGVLAVLHHGNTEKLFRAANSFEEGSRPGESRPPFEDDQRQISQHPGRRIRPRRNALHWRRKAWRGQHETGYRYRAFQGPPSRRGTAAAQRRQHIRAHPQTSATRHGKRRRRESRAF